MEQRTLGAASDSAASRRHGILLLLFLSGLLLGCLLARKLGLCIRLVPSSAQHTADAFFLALLWNAKFLLAAYLLAFLPAGALVLPVLFGAVGVLLGALAGAVMTAGGAWGLGSLVCCLLFRLLLVLPYGFLLGAWALRQSLRFGIADCKVLSGILVLTAAVLLLAAALECSLGRAIWAVYYEKFGV